MDQTTVEGVALDGCISHPAEGSHPCVCERPKLSVDRSVIMVMGVDLLPAAQQTLVGALELFTVCRNVAIRERLEPFPPARVLPLLN